MEIKLTAVPNTFLLNVDGKEIVVTASSQEEAISLYNNSLDHLESEEFINQTNELNFYQAEREICKEIITDKELGMVSEEEFLDVQIYMQEINPHSIQRYETMPVRPAIFDRYK